MFDKLESLIRKMDALRAERRAAKQPDPPHVTVPESLCRSTELASWMAYFSLVYFLWLYTLDIARDRAGSLHLTHLGAWVGEVQFYFPYIVGFAVVAVGIPYVAKIAIPTFTRLGWREAPTEKAWSLAIAIAVSLVVIAGTFTVQGDTILERDRASVVAVDQAAQENAVLSARIDDVRHRLDEMTGSESQYIRTAASMSPEAYDAFLAQRRDDWQYDRLVSYRATAVEAAALRDQMSELRAQQAVQTVSSQVAGRVTTQANGWIASTLAWLEGARAMLLSFVMDIVCLIMPLIALRLRLKRNQQLGDTSEPIVAGVLSDLRSEVSAPERAARDVAEAMMAGGADPRFAADMAAAAAGPSQKKGRRAFNAETGKWEVYVEPKGHWRPLSTKKNPDGSTEQVLARDTMAMADETGVPDGGARAGSVQDEREEDAPQDVQRDAGPADLAPEQDEEWSARADDPAVAAVITNNELTHLDLQLTDADILALADESAQQNETDQLAAVSEEADGDHTKLPNNEGILVAAE